MKRYLCHEHTLPILRSRLSPDIVAEGLPYGKKISINDVQVSFHPAGHILGSAQIRLDLRRLQLLLSHYNPRQVIVVGDLIHAGSNNEVTAFAELTGLYPSAKFTLIKGNHDRHPNSYLQELGIDTQVDELHIRGIRFAHQPSYDHIPTISGHIHPGVRIRLPHKKYLRFPCYAQVNNQLILPAFSLFTGLDSSTLPSETTYYAIHEDGFFIVATP